MKNEFKISSLIEVLDTKIQDIVCFLDKGVIDKIATN